MQLQPPVKGIFLDIGWTMCACVTLDWLYAIALQERIGEEALRKADPVRLQTVMQQIRAVQERDHLLLDEDAEYAQWLEVYGMFAQAFPEFALTRQDIIQSARDKTYNNANLPVCADTFAALDALRGKYRLGIISDTFPSTWRVLRETGLAGYFDHITLSCDIGVFKPQDAIYQNALAGLGLPANETVFVDDWLDNLHGAAKNGMQGVLISRKGLPREQPANPGYPEVASLTELVALLEQQPGI